MNKKINLSGTISRSSITSINGVTEYGSYINNVNKIILGTNVTNISLNTFAGISSDCEIWISSTVTKIWTPFSDSSPESKISRLKVHPDNQYFSSMHNCNCIIYIGPDDTIDKAHTEYKYNSNNSKGYKSYTLIRGCNNSVIIDEIEEFADHIFCNTQIPSIDTKDKITYIGSVAFGYNDNLTKIILGKNVQKIVSNSISSSKLKAVYIRAIEPPENENTFSNCPNDFKIYVEPGCGEVYKNHSSWSNFANKIQEAESEF